MAPSEERECLVSAPTWGHQYRLEQSWYKEKTVRGAYVFTGGVCIRDMCAAYVHVHMVCDSVTHTHTYYRRTPVAQTPNVCKHQRR